MCVSLPDVCYVGVGLGLGLTEPRPLSDMVMEGGGYSASQGHLVPPSL